MTKPSISLRHSCTSASCHCLAVIVAGTHRFNSADISIDRLHNTDRCRLMPVKDSDSIVLTYRIVSIQSIVARFPGTTRSFAAVVYA